MTAGEQDRTCASAPLEPIASGEAPREEMVLLVSLLLEDPDLAVGEGLRRVARQLRLCADIPELAASIVDCDPRRLDAGLLRMTANRLAPSRRADH